MSSLFIVDDQDASIKYTGRWNLTGQQADFSQTAFSASSDATMSFAFSGNSVTVVGDLYTGGSCNGTFAIDGNNVSNFSSPITNFTQNQQTLWSSPTLNEGNHTLVYTTSSCNSSQSFFSIDYLLYNSSTTSSTGATLFFDDSDSQIVYSGSTNSTSGINDFQGTITGLQNGGSLQFKFGGTSVQVYGRVDNATAGAITDASFSVDGAPSVSFTAVTTSVLVHNKQFFSSRPLSSGQHTLTVSNKGGIPLWVDYILVRGQTDVGSTPLPASTSGSSHHPLGIIVGSIVGAGLILLIGIAIFLFRRRSLPFFPSRPKNHRPKSPPPAQALNLNDALPRHRPKFIPQDVPSSVSDMTHSSVELHSFPYRRLPHSQAPSTYDLSVADDSFATSDITYHDEDYLGHTEQPQLSREGSYATLPSPYSIRQGHRSYRSESSAPRSVAPYSGYSVHTEEGPRAYVASVTEHSSVRNSSNSGYGFSSVPPRRIRRSTVTNPTTEEENISVAELKRRQGEVYVLSVAGMHSEPVVHTDSGIRLRDPEFEPELPPMYTAE
ncbi:hypothetical protein D9757_007578 [Collybiopsis confluens]|uniref:Transmembrane protein n=1 Tax=Collybiopsis confluens TaxID=2823264 RepID=A0A8H5M5F5_9AGAR|nr:hypothetical protein D9757_007578 [Collybiopsis confluens]